MKIDFDDIPMQVLDRFKGGELHYDASMYVDGLNRIMRGRLVPGASIGQHTHTDSSEIIFVTSGKGTVECDGVVEELLPGQCHYCPKGSTHTLANKGEADLTFLAVVPCQ